MRDGIGRTGFVVVLVATAFSVMSGVVAAAPIAFDEAVNGDVDAALPFVFDVGINTVSGTFGQAGSLLDFDSFAFAVPAGAELAGAQIQTTDATGDISGASWNFFAACCGLLEEVNVGSPDTQVFQSPPQGPGDYTIMANIFQATTDPAQADYTFTFTVRAAQAPVPEAATAVLLGVGALGIGMTRWRRRRP